MKKLIVRLGLEIGQFVAKMGAAKQAAKGLGKDLGKSMAVSFATEKTFGLFRKEANTELKKVEADVTTRGASLKRQLAGAFTAGAFVAIGKASVDSAQRIKNFMDTTGKSAQEVQEADNAMKRNGQTMEGFVGKLDTLNEARKDAVEKNPELRDTFRDFGVSLDDLRNPMLSNLDLAKKMGMALQGMAPTDEQRNALRELLGQNAEQFLTAIKALGDKNPLDILANEPAIKNIDRANTLIGQIWQNFKNIGTNVIGGALGKAFEFPDAAKSWLSQKEPMIQSDTRDVIRGAMDWATMGKSEEWGIGSAFEKKWEESVERKKRNPKPLGPLGRLYQWVFLPSSAENPHARSTGEVFGPEQDPNAGRVRMFRLQEEKELAKLAFDLAEQQKRTDFERLSRYEKEAALRNEILGYLEEAQAREDFNDPVGAAEARLDAEKSQNKLDDLQRENLPNLQNPIGPDSLAKNNIFVGGARPDDVGVVTALSIQRARLSLLKSIEKKFTARQAALGGL